jgi:hypothetical protein
MKNILHSEHPLCLYTTFFYDVPFGKFRAVYVWSKFLLDLLCLIFEREIINNFSAVVCPRGTFYVRVFTIFFTTCRVTEREWDGQTDRQMVGYYVCIHTHRWISYFIWFGHVIMFMHCGWGVLLLAWCWKLENKVVIATGRFGSGPWKEKRQNIWWKVKRENVIILTYLILFVILWHVLIKKTLISSSSVLDVSELLYGYKNKYWPRARLDVLTDLLRK